MYLRNEFDFSWVFRRNNPVIQAGGRLVLGSSNGCHSGPKIFKPVKNLEFFRLKNFGSRVAILVGLSD